MLQNDIVAAPTVDDVADLFDQWRATPYGLHKSRSEFYEFLTTPSVERSHFLQTRKVDIQSDNGVVITKYY